MQSLVHNWITSLAGSRYESCKYMHAIVDLTSMFVHFLLMFWAYTDIIYPYIVYPLLARKHKTGSLKVLHSMPFGIPIMIKQIRAVRSQHLLKLFTQTQLSRNCKTQMMRTLFRWSISTRDPENLKAVLATKFDHFDFYERNQKLGPIFGSGIFTQDGALWKHSRAILRPQFGRNQISRLENLNEHINDLIEAIRKQNNDVEIQKLFHMLTMDSATDFLFGTSVESLKFSDTDRGSYVTDDQGQRIYAADFVQSYTWLNDFALKNLILNNFSWVAKYLNPEYPTHQKRAQTFIDFYVQRALDNTKDYAEKQNEEGTDGEESYTFSYELAKVTRDPIVLRDQILNILIAGRDTTASTLSYAVWYFAKYPEMWQKAREEVLKTFPDGDISDLTYESLRQLQYVQMFIKEVLRLRPVVPLNMRQASRDTTLPRGGGSDGNQPIFVPKGTVVNYSVYVMHRDKEIYGEDAEEFRPERWASTNKVSTSPMYAWGYLPFNGGPRICLGQQFALTELSLTIVKLALAFKAIEKAPGFQEDPLERNTLTLMVGGDGVRVRFVPN